jgi:NAD(P)-dependent dehydrogenase (short-subunit alcohol dehydrogenase family)
VAFTYNTGHTESEAVAGQVRDLAGKALIIGVDLADPEAAAAVAVAAAAGEFGRLDILVNYAGPTPDQPLCAAIGAWRRG